MRGSGLERGETRQSLPVSMFLAQPGSQKPKGEAGTLAQEAAGWGEGDMGWGPAESDGRGHTRQLPGQSGWTTQASAWAADRYACHMPGWEQPCRALISWGLSGRE